MYLIYLCSENKHVWIGMRIYKILFKTYLSRRSVEWTYCVSYYYCFHAAYRKKKHANYITSLTFSVGNFTSSSHSPYLLGFRICLFVSIAVIIYVYSGRGTE